MSGAPLDSAAFAEWLLTRCAEHAAACAWPPRDAEEWQRVALALAHHGLAPMAGAQHAARSSAPAAIARSLTWAQRSARLTQRAAVALLAEIAARFDADGIAHAVLKGPHLAAAYYDDDLPRPYGDIDLLVAKADLDRAVHALASHGYVPAGGWLSQRFQRRAHFHLVMRTQRRGLPMIELHWSLVDRANSFRIDDRDVLARATPQSVGAASFRVLSPEDDLLYLCLHAAKHGLANRVALTGAAPVAWFCDARSGNRMLWFADIELLLRAESERLDWNAAAARCREWNVENEIATCLSVMELVLPESRAKDAARRLGLANSAARAGLADRLALRVLSHPRFAPWLDMHESAFFRPARLLFLAGTLFPPRAELLRFYGTAPRWLAPLLRLLHPFNVLRRILAGA